jgi:diaminopimelate epimerase
VLGVSFEDLFPACAGLAATARTASLVWTGTPHCVILGAEPTDEEFRRVSPLVEHDARFPERVSAMWAAPAGRRALRVRPWERAVGETAACGTGAAAAAVAAVLTGAADGPVDVAMTGGLLSIEWPGEGAEVVHSGPARLVFNGILACV